MNTENLLQIVNEKNVSIRDLNITEIIPNVIENVIVAIVNEKCLLHLPNNMSGTDHKHWKNGRGGVFSRDINKYINGKSYGKYILIEDKKETKIVRLIEDKEFEMFNTLKLIDGKIKDKNFMILRCLVTGESLTKNDRYIDQNIDLQDVPKIVIPNITSIPEDNDNFNRESISLFD